MKPSDILKVALVALPLLLSSCASKKKAVVEEPKPLTAEEVQNMDFLTQVRSNQVDKRFITSKVKFSVEVGSQKLTLTGNLKMKRDEVIRLQLMAFGFVEAGRIELTKEYVLIMDRINKQYIKAPYMQIDFLRNNGLNFNSMQALFWNELTKPNQYYANTATAADSTQAYTFLESGDDMVIGFEEGKMEYSWLADRKTGVIRMANMLYKDKLTETTSQLNWDYDDFTMVGAKPFPKQHGVTLTVPNKEVKLGLKLNYIQHESDWELRTDVSSKYREVTVDEILRRFMSL